MSRLQKIESTGTETAPSKNRPLAWSLISFCSLVLVGAGCTSLRSTPDEPLPDADRASANESARRVAQQERGSMSPESLQSLLLHEAELTSAPLVEGNDAKLLLDGPATFAAIHQAIDGAADEVLVEFFILADDEVGQRFADHLIAAAGRGVDVRVIYDALGSLGTSSEFIDRIRQGGVAIYADKPPLEAPHKINNRNHRKLVVVDNRLAILGGVNVTRAYASSSATNPGEEHGLDSGWRDTSMRIAGPVVDHYRELFSADWVELGEPPLESAPVPGRLGEVRIRPLYGNGGDDELNIYRTYMNAIAHARQRIWLTHAYFAPNEELIAALESAARRGVDVRVLLPGFIDFDMIYHASRANYDRLLAAGVRIYERTDALLHSKTAVVDGVWSTVGSANLDIRSFIHNDEVNAVVIDAQFGQRMEQLFVQDLTEAEELSLEQWRKRGILARVKEFFAKRANYFL